MGLLIIKRKAMGRMHSKGKGISRRCLPYRKAPPSWVQINADDLTGQMVKMAKRGSSPSQIGVVLRDSFGIPQIKGVTGSKILRILKVNGSAPTIPEDLYHLIKKAVNVRKHIEKFRADKDGKFRHITPARVTHTHTHKHTATETHT